MFFPNSTTYYPVQTSTATHRLLKHLDPKLKAEIRLPLPKINKRPSLPNAYPVSLSAEIARNLDAVVQEAIKSEYKRLPDGSILPIANPIEISFPFICQKPVLRKELADINFPPPQVIIASPFIPLLITQATCIDENEIPVATPVIPLVKGLKLSSIHKTSRKALEILIKENLLDYTCLDKLKEAQAFELFITQKKKENAITKRYSFPLQIRTSVGAYVLSFFNSVPFNPQADLLDLYNKINSAQTSQKTNSFQVILTAEISRLIMTLADDEIRQKHIAFSPPQELSCSIEENVYSYQRSNIIFQVEQLGSDVANISLEEANFMGNCAGIGAGVIVTATLVSNLAIATIALNVVTESKRKQAYS